MTSRIIEKVQKSLIILLKTQSNKFKRTSNLPLAFGYALLGSKFDIDGNGQQIITNNGNFSILNLRYFLNTF